MAFIFKDLKEYTPRSVHGGIHPSVIPATREEAGKILVQGQLLEKVSKTPSQQNKQAW
jgi:hypothetical protein